MDIYSATDARQEAAVDPVARAIMLGATYLYDVTSLKNRTWGRFSECGFLTIPRSEMPPETRTTLDICEDAGIGLWVEAGR